MSTTPGNDETDAGAARLWEVLVPLLSTPFAESVPTCVCYELFYLLPDDWDPVLADLAESRDHHVDDAGVLTVLTAPGFARVSWNREDGYRHPLRLDATLTLWPIGLSLIAKSQEAKLVNNSVAAASIELVADEKVLLTLPSAARQRGRREYLGSLTKIVGGQSRP